VTVWKKIKQVLIGKDSQLFFQQIGTKGAYAFQVFDGLG
jgi:hypothetical protein